MAASSSFVYPPLPASDSLRLLTLRPGCLGAPLVGTLASEPFAAKPSYLALSYTWNDRDDKQASVQVHRAIELNSHEVPLGHNLALALQFMRPKNGGGGGGGDDGLKLWTDQLCINQGDGDERNAQVALMAFIYKRARHVVCWLGLPDADPQHMYLEGMEMQRRWQEGQASTLGQETPVFSGGRLEPALVRDNPYWTRVWIVQEVCLPRSIRFLHGELLWSERQVLSTMRTSAVDNDPGPMNRLLQARESRFTDAMKLERLIENFMHCGCGEIRDRVYGLLGLANDVDSIAGSDLKDMAGNAPARRGRGAIPVDYKRSFHDIWCDVVQHMFFHAERTSDFGETESEKEDERGARVVRFAGVVQKALDGKVDEEAQQPDFLLGRAAPPLLKQPSGSAGPFIQAKAYVAGRILSTGPTYSAFVDSYREGRKWESSWLDHYTAAGDLDKLRVMEETYAPKIIGYGEPDLARIAAVPSPDTLVWSSLQDLDPDKLPPSRGGFPGGEPSRFLGTQHCMGLAPHAAEPGDLVLRFWDCDAAVVVRARKPLLPIHGEFTITALSGGLDELDDWLNSTLDSKQTSKLMKDASTLYELVGRADIAEPWLRRDRFGDQRAKDALKVDRERYRTKAKYVRMDMATLQRVSVAIGT